MSNAPKPSEMKLAEIMAELESISEKVQSTEIDLDDSLNLLKRGKDLIQAAKKHLTTAENELVQIKEELAEA